MQTTTKSSFFSLLAAFALTALSTVSNAKLFVPDIEPWDIWVLANQTNEASIDHSSWQQLLNRYLETDAPDGINRFGYAAVMAADKVRLQDYISRLAALDPRDYKRSEQLAYWLNLYNALTVQVVLEYYPVSSIRRIKGGLFGTGPWNEELVTVAGQSLTLNDIEHRILRPIWRDPRIHYAVNCASLGCPDLSAQAYTATNTEQLMDESARAFINNPRGVELLDGRLTLSSIYNWFDIDFGGDQADRLAHIASYADQPLAASLREWQGRIRYQYNWDLNEAD